MTSSSAAARSGGSPAASADSESQYPSGEGVYYLAIDEPTELRIASAWFRAKFPRAALKEQDWPCITSRIPLSRLNRRATIVPIIRGEDRSPASKAIRDIHGAPHVEHVPTRDLALEVRVCRPVAVEDHWRSKADEWDGFGGEINRSTFVSAMGQSASPVCAKIHVGRQDELRLSFV